MADPGVCIGCKTCMAACLHKHDVVGDAAVARLNLVETLTVSAPVACRHCADAPCAAACPTHALYHDGGRIAVDLARCIGCRGCVMACPFGAVSVVSSPATARLGNLTINGANRSAVIKCDLCADRPEGPACVQACPTKGLVVVDRESLERQSAARRREAALNTSFMSSIPLNDALVAV